MARGEREGKVVFFQFFHSVTRARARAKINFVANIRKAAPKDWKAAAWLLERMFPTEYGRTAPREETDKTTPDGMQPAVTLQVKYLSPDESREILQAGTPPTRNGH